MTEPVSPQEPPGPVLVKPERAADEPATPTAGRQGAKAGRFWSVRRIPAALLALVVLGGAGLLLYDIAAVRADRPAMQWRRSTADHLARWRVDEPWVIVVAAAVALLGLWLILLALTPGLRSLLPMRRDDPTVRAGLDRDAAALVLRDRAMEVPGVQSVRVRLRRKKATVRARSHFRELDDVRTDLDTTLAGAVAALGLARPPALTVRVARPSAKKG
ncbi:DUF6286 domain-containing protein [Streptomyces albipurpureus]|uniref:DUF6286 domain-containing protein n=1 Tax=Streptomyces albipurpureus TaxID=2897419 RepID=A0ABT0USV8_9ACTN|nr:DUF6286 domain-containing protein [Streptomyces sp. CWNU-1]MCM2391545.1 DUF6286 domain-containing protein [Streptomyces sp. CWNU-1]